MPADLDFFYAPDRSTWRHWLADNHATAPGVWFVFYKKKTGQPTLSYDEAVEEALCYGWIDSLPKALDSERHALKFSPRKSRSVWSKPNKDRIERLVAAGRMTPAGQAKIDAAKQDGSWDALNDSDALRVPADLAEALRSEPAAEQNWATFSPSVRKNILYWIGSAKQPATRQKRIDETVRLAALGKRAQYDR